ncbi:peroxidase 5-like [Miscanthus floridulus]|uniref:peroxidase 5-like n=1 Tax=Miscanthus floridulus TaxID=154761 RepID=UPI00345B4B05
MVRLMLVESTSADSSFNGRLYSYGPSGTGHDPSMDPAYLAALTQQCPQGSGDPAVPMDPVTPTAFDTNYYANLVAKRGLLLASDQALLADLTTAAQVVGYTNSPATFQTDFVAAMIKMGANELLTGTAGTIRTNCRVAS